MKNPFDDYLNLLDQIREELARLSELAKQKTQAVRSDDLIALDQILKQEQAAALNFRGLEQKQTLLLKTTGMNGIPLSALAESFPPSMRLEARQKIEQLQAQYQVYRGCAEVARNTLECNIHEIEKIISASTARPSAGPGYHTGEPEIPPKMRTDFRA